MKNNIIVISVAAVIDGKNNILLGKRKWPEGEDGLYGFPGGKVDFNESTLDCVIRELGEETNIFSIFPPDFLRTIEPVINDLGQHLVEFFYAIRLKNTKEIVNMEQTKCYGWEWHNLDNLPSPKTRTLILFEEQLARPLKEKYASTVQYGG